jgi:hypothetical protein
MPTRNIARLLPFSFIGLLTLIAGCGSTTMGVSPDFEFRPNDSHGLVVVSTRWITPSKRHGFMPHVRRTPARNINEKMGTVLNVINSFIKPDFTNPPGYFYVMKLEAGKYEISSPEMLKAIYFDVPAREIVYIGELEFRHVLGCNQAPGPGCKPNMDNHVVHRVHNQWQRDKKLLPQRLKHFRADSVIVRLAKPARS